jgi:Kef-type K+ transport system membrane component KefB
MALSEQDVARMLVALTLLLVMAHATGHLFARLRQPAVIGEILGGLLLGPTLLGTIAPDIYGYLFPDSRAVATVLSATSHLGVLFLIFLAGAEVRPRLRGREGRTVAIVASTGLVLPFAVGIAAGRMFDADALAGPHGSDVTITLVLGIAVAVTSVPVISRIMLDLNIMHTSLARMVLSVAIIEDVVLYVVLAVVLGLAQANSPEFGLTALLPHGSVAALGVYHVAVSLLFFAVFLAVGPRLFRWLADHRANVLERRSPTAFRLVFLLMVVLTCILLGVNSIFGALLAGSSAAKGDAGASDGEPTPERRQAWTTLRQFCMAFFVPLYFAGVGLSLDLVHHFDVAFFLGFVVLACVAKFGSVLLGSLLAGESAIASTHLAVALNARGGPGIVLATVTLTAGVINESLFTTLVLLSIITSQLAGTWLDFTFGRRRRDGEDAMTPTGLAVPGGRRAES